MQFTFVRYCRHWHHQTSMCLELDWPALCQISHLFAHSVPLLCFLHWLPVKVRTVFKITLRTYKTLCEKQPVYLHWMLVLSLPSHSLRLNKGITCLSLGSRLKQVQDHFTRTFFSLAIWPTSVSTFRTHLKTSVWLCFTPIDAKMPDGPMILWNCFINVAAEHCFGVVPLSLTTPGILTL